jgi:hypothetical protein
MNEVEKKTSSPPDFNQLQAQVESLRHLVVSLLVLLVVVSGTLNLYLLRQVRFTRNDLNAVRLQTANINMTGFIAEYEKTTRPAMDEFVRKITQYGQTHPDFAPIMAKYGLNPQTATTTGAPPSKALPTPPVAKPKK